MGSPDIWFSEDHIWIMESKGLLRIGITDYAQEQLGEIVEVSLMDAETYFDAGDTFGELESQIAVTELISPISGSIQNINERVIDDPSIINVDPYGRGWLIEIEPSNGDELSALMDEESYENFIED